MAALLLQNIYHLAIGDAAGTRQRGVDLLSENGRISAIGAKISPPPSCEVIDCSTKLVMPGLVNTHHHMYQTLQRNVPHTQNAELFDWLVGLYPIWSHLTARAVEVSTTLAVAELLKTGCTTSSDHHYVFPAGVDDDLISLQVKAARRAGIRFCATRGSMSRGKSAGGLPPDSIVQDEERIIDDCEALIASVHDPAPLSLTRLALAPCSPFSVTPELMQKTSELALARGVKLHTHLAETIDEQDYCLEHYGKRPLALMADWGWLGEHVWFAHGIHFDDSELELLAKTQTGVAHCATSNMRLGSGFCRLPEMIKRGVPVALAVDGSASNDSSDMLGELRNCLLLHRVKHGASVLTADQVQRLGAYGGARVLGWDRLGELKVGQGADLAVIEMNRLDYAGALSDPLAAVLFCGSRHETAYTIVAGEIVVREGALVHVDEPSLCEEANAISKAMLAAEGLSTAWMP